IVTGATVISTLSLHDALPISDVELAPAGGRDRAASVGPGAGADDRRVADAAVALVGHATGRGTGGKVSLCVQRHRAHGAEVALGDRKSTRLNSSHVKMSYAVF